MVLADFSSEANLIERYRQNIAVERLKASSINQLIASVEVSITKYQRKRAELDGLVTPIESIVKPSILGRIKRRFYILKNHQALVSELHAISRDLAHRFEETSGYVIQELRRTIHLKINSNLCQSYSDIEIHKRIGRETSIVYVAKKSVQP